MYTPHRKSRQISLKMCLSQCKDKKRLASNADMGYHSQLRKGLCEQYMREIITVTRLMSSLGIKHRWVKVIYL